MPNLSYKNAGTAEYKTTMDKLGFDQLFPASDEHSNYVRSWASGLPGIDDDPYRWMSESLEILNQAQKGETEEQRRARESLHDSLDQMIGHFFTVLKTYMPNEGNPEAGQGSEDAWKRDMAFVDHLDEVSGELDAYNLSTGYDLMGTPQMRTIYGMVRGMQQVKADLDEKAFQEELKSLPETGKDLKARGDEVDKVLRTQCMADMELGVKPGEEAEAVETLKSEIEQLDLMIAEEQKQMITDIHSIQPPEIRNRRAALEAMYVLDEAKIQENMQKMTKLKEPYYQDMYTQYNDALTAAGFEERERYKGAVQIDHLFKAAHEAFKSGVSREELDIKVEAAIDAYGEQFGTDFRYDKNNEGRTMSDDDLENLLNETDREFQGRLYGLTQNNKNLKQADDIRFQTDILNERLEKNAESADILKSYGDRIFPKTKELLTDLQSLEVTRKGIKANQEKTEQGLRTFMKESGEEPEKEFEKLKAQASSKNIGQLEKEAQKARADFDKVKENDTGLYEKQKKAITDARNKIIADITEKRKALSDKKEKLEDIVKARSELQETNRKLAEDYRKYDTKVSGMHYETQTDSRIVRLKESLDAMWGKVDYLTSGSNSDEFKDMRRALQEVSGNGSISKDKLEHLKLMTETYLEKKKGFFHIESHKKRSYRLAFAKDLKQLTENGLRSWNQAGKDLRDKMVLINQRGTIRTVDDPLTNKLADCSHDVELETDKAFVTLAQQRQNMKTAFSEITGKIEKERAIVGEKISMLQVPGQKEAGNPVKEPVKAAPEARIPGGIQ